MIVHRYNNKGNALNNLGRYKEGLEWYNNNNIIKLLLLSLLFSCN